MKTFEILTKFRSHKIQLWNDNFRKTKKLGGLGWWNRTALVRSYAIYIAYKCSFVLILNLFIHVNQGEFISSNEYENTNRVRFFLKCWQQDISTFELICQFMWFFVFTLEPKYSVYTVQIRLVSQLSRQKNTKNHIESFFIYMSDSTIVRVPSGKKCIPV